MSNNHHEEHYDVVNGMKQGHGKIPKFLIFVYAILAVWAVSYALLADGIDDRQEMAQASGGVSVENGKAAVQANSCTACHGADLKGTLAGPDLTGVVERLGGEAGVIEVLTKGRNAMPSFQGRLSEDQMKSVVEYLKTL